MSTIVKRNNPLNWVDDAIQNFFTPSGSAHRFFEDFERTAYPVMDLLEKNNEIVLTAEIPGMDKKDIDISVHDNILTIRGEKKHEKKEEKENYLWMERSYGVFTRSIRLPDHVDTKKVEASYKNGLLTLVMPKTEDAQPKKIEVRD